MIQITPHMKVFVHIETVDFRAGIDGLCKICREGLKADPFDGTVFVFRGRQGTSVKLLIYDGQGFWLCQKRLSEGRFVYWPRSRGDAKITGHSSCICTCVMRVTIGAKYFKRPITSASSTGQRINQTKW